MNARPGLDATELRDAIQSATQAWLKAISARSRHSPTKMAEEIGAATSTITRPFYGKTKSIMDQSTVRKLVSHYGLAPPPELAVVVSGAEGFAEGEVEEITEAPPPEASPLGPGQNVWRVRAGGMEMAGYLPGDWFILDQNLAADDGDHVIAQVYDLQIGNAETVLRIHRRGWLVPPNPSAQGILYADGERVKIMGVIVKSWRRRR